MSIITTIAAFEQSSSRESQRLVVTICTIVSYHCFIRCNSVRFRKPKNFKFRFIGFAIFDRLCTEDCILRYTYGTSEQAVNCILFCLANVIFIGSNAPGTDKTMVNCCAGDQQQLCAPHHHNSYNWNVRCSPTM